MITANKKNKILTILTALVISLIAIIFPFVIKNNNKNMGVLAESSTAPDITLDWFTNFSNYNDIDLHSSFLDFNSSNSSITLHCNLLDGVSFNNSSLSTKFYFKSSLLIEFSESVSFSFFNSSLYKILKIDFIAPNSTIFFNLLTLPFLIVFEYNGDFFIISSLSYEYAYESYKEALSSDYNDGYDAGLSAGESIGYENGYNSAVNGILNGSTFIPAIAYYNNNTLTTKTGKYISSLNGHYTFTNTFFNDLSQIQSSFKLYQVTLRIEDLDFKFTDNTLINVINNISIGSTLTFNVEYGTHTTGDSSIVWHNVLYTIIPVIENNNIVDYKLNYKIPDELYNKRVLYINITFSDVLNTIPYTYLNNVDIYDLNSSYSSGYNNGYDVGFNAGVDSVDTSVSYNNGYNNGYNQGKNDGILSANDYSFLGLIGAIVDAPINAFTSLFNFEILGFNMANFFLGLFTLCVIIVIVKFVMGGK